MSKTIKLFDTEDKFFIGIESVEGETTTITPLVLLYPSKFISKETYMDVVKKMKMQYPADYMPTLKEVLLKEAPEEKKNV